MFSTSSTLSAQRRIHEIHHDQHLDEFQRLDNGLKKLEDSIRTHTMEYYKPTAHSHDAFGRIAHMHGNLIKQHEDLLRRYNAIGGRIDTMMMMTSYNPNSSLRIPHEWEDEEQTAHIIWEQEKLSAIQHLEHDIGCVYGKEYPSPGMSREERNSYRVIEKQWYFAYEDENRKSRIGGDSYERTHYIQHVTPVYVIKEAVFPRVATHKESRVFWVCGILNGNEQICRMGEKELMPLHQGVF